MQGVEQPLVHALGFPDGDEVFVDRSIAWRAPGRARKVDVSSSSPCVSAFSKPGIRSLKAEFFSQADRHRPYRFRVLIGDGHVVFSASATSCCMVEATPSVKFDLGRRHYRGRLRSLRVVEISNRLHQSRKVVPPRFHIDTSIRARAPSSTSPAQCWPPAFLLARAVGARENFPRWMSW